MALQDQLPEMFQHGGVMLVEQIELDLGLVRAEHLDSKDQLDIPAMFLYMGGETVNGDNACSPMILHLPAAFDLTSGLLKAFTDLGNARGIEPPKEVAALIERITGPAKKKKRWWRR